jgi:hypothetical protein
MGKFISLLERSCNISAYDVKCNGICISGLAFVRGTLFDPAFGGLSGRYPTGQGINKHVGVRRSGLAYLSRCNSSWFCHSGLPVRPLPSATRRCSLSPPLRAAWTTSGRPLNLHARSPAAAQLPSGWQADTGRCAHRPDLAR